MTSLQTAEGMRCPNCLSGELISVQMAALDIDLLECPCCKRAYEVKSDRLGNTSLVAV